VRAVAAADIPLLLPSVGHVRSISRDAHPRCVPSTRLGLPVDLAVRTCLGGYSDNSETQWWFACNHNCGTAGSKAGGDHCRRDSSSAVSKVPKSAGKSVDFVVQDPEYESLTHSGSHRASILQISNHNLLERESYPPPRRRRRNHHHHHHHHHHLHHHHHHHHYHHHHHHHHYTVNDQPPFSSEWTR